MDVALTLDRLVPGAKYRGSLTANTQEAYEKIRWEDKRVKPTWEELNQETLILQEEDLADLKDEYKKKVEEEFINKLEKGFMYEGSTIQADEKAQNNMTSYMSAVSAALDIFPLHWRTRENDFIVISHIDDFNIFAASMLKFKQEAYADKWAVKDQIEQATSKQALQELLDQYTNTL